MGYERSLQLTTGHLVFQQLFHEGWQALFFAQDRFNCQMQIEVDLQRWDQSGFHECTSCITYALQFQEGALQLYSPT